MGQSMMDIFFLWGQVLSVVVGIVVVFIFIPIGAMKFFLSRCPKCKRFFSFGTTEYSSMYEVCRCQYCGYRMLRKKSSGPFGVGIE